VSCDRESTLFFGSNFKTASISKEAQEENEVNRISSLGERIAGKKLKQSNKSFFLLRKSMKSMKERRPEAARSALPLVAPIFFQNDA
jgi:hypothetical protein